MPWIYFNLVKAIKKGTCLYLLSEVQLQRNDCPKWLLCRRFSSSFFNLVMCHSLGHAHLTDFNIATIIKDGERATALAGTKPYMGKIYFVYIVAF